MYVLATCTATVLRGTTADDYGDPVETGTEIARELPMAIKERVRTVWDQTTQTPRTVRTYSAAAPSTADIQVGDQVRDDTHQVLYAVEERLDPTTMPVAGDLRLTLKRVTKG